MKFSTITEKVKKNKLRSGAIATGMLLIAGAFVGIGSSAVFTDTEDVKSFSNTGKVEIDVTDSFTAGNILPGVPRSAPLVIDNSASTAKVALSISEVTPPSVNNPGGADFSEYTVEIQNANGTVIYGPVAANAIVPGPINAVIAEGGSLNATVVWRLAEGAGNEYQTLNVHYSKIAVTATQIVP